MDGIRLSAPSNYNWDFSFINERIKRDPIDYLIFLFFLAHAIGFFVLLVYLRVQRANKKMFVVSN